MFYFIFRNCHLKGAQRDVVYILSALKVFLKRMKQKRPLKNHPPLLQRGQLFFIFNCLLQIEFSRQPISEYWNRTTILIPFLQTIKHFCNFIPSYFMKRFAFLIDDTSYIRSFYYQILIDRFGGGCNWCSWL